MNQKKRFTVVQASAGSGKTYTLVKEYLLLLLRSQDVRYYRHVLAITFTNKATNEMKERVIDALDGISSGADKYVGLTDDLAEELGLSSSDVIQKSTFILRNLLHDYAEFSISTIDRFIYRIIKSFSFELNLSGNAEIEMNRDSIIEAGVDSFLESLSVDNSITGMLVDFSDYKFSAGKSTNIRRDLIELAGEIINDKAAPYLDELEGLSVESFAEVRNKLWSRKNGIEKELRAKADILMQTIDNNGIDYSEISGGARALPGYLKNNFLAKNITLKEPTSGVIKIAESGNWKSSKVKADRAHLIDSLAPKLSELLDDFLESFNQNRSKYIFCDLMVGRIYTMALIKEIYEEINRYKIENDLVQLDDFNSLIAKLIDDSPVPYIYERTGEKFNHYLIDEFQDTSQIQWYNLLPLVENTLADGFSSLLVGDSKQAIYRFRGGDVQQMSRLPVLHFDDRSNEDLLFTEQALSASFEKKNLESNYRSFKQVVNFVNDFFTTVKQVYSEDIADIYDGHHQELIKEGEGSVRIKFLNKDDGEDLRLEEIGKQAESFLKGGYSYADITILCRKRDQCTKVADYLIGLGHPVLSSESLKLHFSNEVAFLIHWIRWIKESEDDGNAFGILQYLSNEDKYGGLTNDEMLATWMETGNFERTMKKAFPDFHLSDLTNASLLELCDQLIRKFLSDRSGDPFVLNFLDHVSKFQNKWGNNISKFLEWWDEKGVDLDIEMPPSEDSIKIMTIHKSKGLEFKVVILPFMSGKISPNEDFFWVRTEGVDNEIMPIAWLPSVSDLQFTNYVGIYKEEMKKSLLDALNLMYVAMTRAAEHLVILSTKQNDTLKMDMEENILWKCFQLAEYKGGEDSGEFLRGEEIPIAHTQTEKSQDQFIFEEGKVVDWKERVSLKFRVDKNVLSEDTFSAQEYGNFMHDVLSRMNYLSELPEILKSFVSGGLISDEVAQSLAQNVDKTITGSEVEEYFIEGDYFLYNERELLSSEGSVYRPDRMVVTGDEILIIDYKTGIPDQKHEEQLRTYRRVLMELEEKPIRSFLIYFGNGEIRNVA